MTYSVRSDKRLMKRFNVNKKTIYLYANSVKELYDKYQTCKNENRDIFYQEQYNFITYANMWLKLNSSGKEMATIKEYEYILKRYLIPYFRK